jgi:hypothetical protein
LTDFCVVKYVDVIINGSNVDVHLPLGDQILPGN